MPLIIDTYNVLHVVGVLPPDLAGIDVGGLARLIGTSRYGRERTALVCDGVRSGEGPPGGTGRVSIRYAGPGRKADDLIAVMVRQSSAPGRITVVSSDRQVLRVATRRRCKTITSDDFLKRLLADFETPRPGRKAPRGDGGPLRESQIEGWARVFGLDANAELPEDVKPSEEDLRALLQKGSEPQVGPAEDTPEPVEESAVDSPPEAPIADQRPRPAPPPILPGRIIREAASLLAESERASADPSAPPSEPDNAEEAVEDDDSNDDGRSPGLFPEELFEADSVEPIVPPEIIRQAEQLLAELEAGLLKPPEEKDEA